MGERTPYGVPPEGKGCCLADLAKSAAVAASMVGVVYVIIDTLAKLDQAPTLKVCGINILIMGLAAGAFYWAIFVDSADSDQYD